MQLFSAGSDVVDRDQNPILDEVHLLQYSRDFYEHQEGAAIGSPVLATVANLYMEFFKDMALKSSPRRPRLWKRYVDDTFCIIKRGGQLQNSWTISMD